MRWIVIYYAEPKTAGTVLLFMQNLSIRLNKENV